MNAHPGLQMSVSGLLFLMRVVVDLFLLNHLLLSVCTVLTQFPERDGKELELSKSAGLGEVPLLKVLRLDVEGG